MFFHENISNRIYILFLITQSRLIVINFLIKFIVNKRQLKIK